tara:strand:+ start:756 stop:881 length:126 start_codon:yes stop_codon:yes gene_type:complete
MYIKESGQALSPSNILDVPDKLMVAHYLSERRIHIWRWAMP